jgi:hypothetical protein
MFGGIVVDVGAAVVVDDDGTVVVAAPATAGAPKASANAHTAAPVRPIVNIPIQVGILPPNLQARAPSPFGHMSRERTLPVKLWQTPEGQIRLPGGI